MSSGARFTPVPVTVLSGFLGSGKTTLLRRLLASDAYGDTAVLINEFGEIGIDDLLVRDLAPETVLLRNGCICCTIRTGFRDALVELLTARQRGELAPFRRAIVEASGLADPASFLATVITDPILSRHARPGGVITVVDAANAAGQSASQPEWLPQVTAADRLVLSKVDIAGSAAAHDLSRTLNEINPSAPLISAASVVAGDSMVLDAGEGLHLPTRFQADVPAGRTLHDDVRSFAVCMADRVDWTRFALWLAMLLASHGARVLRVKGLLDVEGAGGPVVIQGVQHLMHPPVHLSQWPDQDHRSRLVFIVRGLEPTAIRNSLDVFLGLASSVLPG